MTSVAVGSINPSTWPQYDLIVWSCGRQHSPVNQASERTALQNWVIGGGRLVIEGGEVGYSACSSPGYPTFAQQVLHCSTWYQDQSGNLVRTLGNHPLMTTPNPIPPTITHDYGGDYGTQDGMGVRSEAQGVMTWSAGSGAGLVAYDTNGVPSDGGNIVYYAFEVASVTDATTRDHLIENSTAWLLNAVSEVQDGVSKPAFFQVAGAAPSPFAGTTRWQLRLPAAGQVDLEIFDVTGRVVARPFHGLLPAGTPAVSWDGTGDGRTLPGGVYWARVRWNSSAGREQWIGRVVRMK